MRKLSIYLSILLGTSTIFTSCKKDSTNEKDTLLKKQFTVVLGAEKADEGNYLSTDTEKVYTTDQAIANKAVIDITFGQGDLAAPSLISPDMRVKSGLTFGGQDNVDALVETAFGEQADIADLDDSKITFEFIDKTTSQNSTLEITEGKTYSFSTSLDKKGLIHIDKIEGDGPAAVATVSVIVQK